MTDVVAGNNESFDSLLRRFNRKVQQGGILAEARVVNITRSPVLSVGGREQPRGVR